MMTDEMYSLIVKIRMNVASIYDHPCLIVIKQYMTSVQLKLYKIIEKGMRILHDILMLNCQLY